MGYVSANWKPDKINSSNWNKNSSIAAGVQANSTTVKANSTTVYATGYTTNPPPNINENINSSNWTNSVN